MAHELVCYDVQNFTGESVVYYGGAFRGSDAPTREVGKARDGEAIIHWFMEQVRSKAANPPIVDGYEPVPSAPVEITTFGNARKPREMMISWRLAYRPKGSDVFIARRPEPGDSFEMQIDGSGG